MQTVPMETLMEVISLQLSNGGRANLTVTGNSMAPMLHHRRDAVTLIPVKGAQKKGTVALYHRPNGKYALHRIVAVTKDGYICCGDNQWEKEWVDQAQLVATVDSFCRSGRCYSINHFGYLVYKFFWVELFFLRPAYIAVRRSVGRICRKVRQISFKRNANRRESQYGSEE